MPLKYNPFTRQFNLVNDSVDLGSAFQGPYDSGTDYTIGQAVSKDGKLYVCLAASTGNDPPNPIFWDELEIQGPSGQAGATWFIQDTEPTADMSANDLWLNSSTWDIRQYSGSAWDIFIGNIQGPPGTGGAGTTGLSTANGMFLVSQFG